MKTYSFTVEVESKKTTNLNGYYLDASSENNQHFKRTREYISGNQSVKMTLQAYANVNINTLPFSIEVCLYDRNNNCVEKTYLSTPVQVFTKSFFETYNTNILPFGLAGAGKSSLLNTFLSMLNLEGEVSKFFPEGAGSDHCTTDLRMNFLRDLSNEEKTKIAVWDTW
jgi:hypothetical protein